MAQSTAYSEGDKLAHEKDLAAVALAEAPDKQLDAAGKFLALMAQEPDGEALLAPYTEEEERAVRRKADWIVMPLLFISLSMGAVDKVAIGTAAILGLRTELHLTGSQYSWSSSLIFFGQLGAVLPALFFMQKYSTGKVIAVNAALWGCLTMCMAASHNYGGFAALRFILGLSEALTFPGFGLVISGWYTKKEQVWRVAILYSTLSSFTNGILAYASSFVPASAALSPWQVLFILVGGLTLLNGLFMIAFLPNAPMSARWLTPRQRCIAVLRVRQNMTGVQNHAIKWAQVREALLDPKTWLVFLANVGLNIPNGGTATFSSIIINSLGYNVRQTMLLQIPTGLVSWAGSLFFSWVARRTGQRTLVAFFATFIAVIGTIILHVLPRSNKGGSLVGLFLCYMYWAPYVLLIGSMMANTGGNTKKTMSYGVAYMGYVCGNIIGPQTFRANQAPKYTGGIVAMLVGYCCAILFIGLYYLVLRRLIRKKEEQRAQAQAQMGEHEELELLEDWRDQTDRENPRFRYTI